MARSFDYLIVGGGSAGCVLANRLSEGGRHSVLLLEAGPRDTYPWIHIPIGYGKTMFHPVLNWGFVAEPDPNLNGRRIYTPRGRTLGGSSAINGLIQIRGQPEDFDGWAASGAAGWSWKETLPYFIKSESFCGGSGPWHGADGPLSVSRIKDRHPLVEALIAAAAELGIPRNDDFNGPTQEGAGYLHLTTRNGLRCSAAVAYLRPAEGRPNLAVETDAHVTRVLFDGARAVGVEYARKGRTLRARSAQEVILCAGSVQSPQLLQLSGIGHGEHLSRLGVPVVRHLPGVGENLQDHLILRLMYKCAQPITTNDQLRTILGKLATAARWAILRRGPMAVGVMMGGLITRALPDAKTPDYQFFLSTVSAEERGATPHPWSGFTFNYYPLRPTSRGWVRALSPDSRAHPAIRYNYLSTDYDRRAMVAGFRLTRRIAATRAFAPYVASEYRPGPEVRSDDEMLAYIRSTATTGFHPCGTCRMGTDEGAVVDPRLRVHGIQGLRVADASVMPTIVSGNTNAATIMIAEKAADLIKEDARS
ncbi:MAG TPA: choline dehydrogenase [Burkholderiales bacterium]|nr:choline dehydrogenase [Burkholderiales bacterium]